eukprot:512664_1
MNSQGIKGAIYNCEKKQIIHETDEIDTDYNGLNGYNGLSGNKYGGGGVYQYGKGVYYDEMKKNNKNFQRCFIGFGGGCAKNIQASIGGNGGGKIIILCNNLTINKGS